MPYKIPETNDWLRTTNRKLVQGEPNTGKTTSLLTIPDYQRPVHIVSSPGELGTNSLPRSEGFISYIWESTPETKLDSKTVLAETRQLVVDILSGKRGECKTIVIDGLHKLGFYFLDAASNGTWFQGKDFNIEKVFGKVDPYSKSYAAFDEFMKLIWESSVDNAIFTCWSGVEPGQFAGVKVDGGRIYPGLHGKLAKNLMGMFSFVLYAGKNFRMQGGKFQPVYEWQLKETKEVAGAAIKLPPEIVAKMPDTLVQDWGALDELLKKLAA